MELSDVVKPGIAERFAELRTMGITTVMITGDNPVTARAIAAESGVDDVLAEATPEDKLALIRREQAGGRMVAMTGDGTNDAPALAQADVGVAMNSGTAAAKEAGNMVDLDSDPTKLIGVVEVGKQMLITRGALTTFSLANDVAKYFAILPAMFLGIFPQLAALNVMQLATPQSAILSAVIFNALVIVALIPLALRGVRFRPSSSDRLLRRNLLVYGLGGVVVPFLGILLIDLVVRSSRGSADRHDQHHRHPTRPVRGRRPRARRRSPAALRRQVGAAVRVLLVLTVLLGVVYPRRSGASRACPDCTRTPGLGPHRGGSRPRSSASTRCPRTRPRTPGSTPAPRPRRPTTRSPGSAPPTPRPRAARTSAPPPRTCGRPSRSDARRSPPATASIRPRCPRTRSPPRPPGSTRRSAPSTRRSRSPARRPGHGPAGGPGPPLVADATAGRTLGFLGEPRVNVPGAQRVRSSRRLRGSGREFRRRTTR